MQRTLTDPWGEALTADEATTVWQLAGLTGHPAGQIVRQVNRTLLAQARFQVAVMLATGEWNWLDGETGQWSDGRAEQRERLHRYAAHLFEDEPCHEPTRLI
jgi:hypothetical protein